MNCIHFFLFQMIKTKTSNIKLKFNVKLKLATEISRKLEISSTSFFVPADYSLLKTRDLEEKKNIRTTKIWVP